MSTADYTEHKTVLSPGEKLREITCDIPFHPQAHGVQYAGAALEHQRNA
jgi:hypothetical protein